MLLLIAVLVVWLGLGATWISAIVSASRYSPGTYREAGRPRGGTIALVALTGWLGACYYWLVIKKQLEPYRNVPPA